MSTPPLFADDNSAYRRAAKREQEKERARAARREEIMETLRRLKEESGDNDAQQDRERAQRHADLLERYPPLF